MHRAAKGSELPPPALPHTAPHGSGVHTASHLQASIQTAPTLQAGDLLELRVQDNGAGYTQALLDAGLSEAQVRRVAGENVRDFLLTNLPDDDA